MKHDLKRCLSAVIAVALLLIALGCSGNEKNPTEEIKSNSGSISAEVSKDGLTVL